MDLRAKWQPTSTVRGWPFVTLQWEGLHRNYGANNNPASGLGAQTLRDQGQYGEFLWGFKPGWVLGTRWEQGRGSDPADPLRDKRERVSGNVTFYPSEFSKLRLQANRDIAQHLNNQKGYQLILQTEFLIGAHGGHTF